MIELPVSLHAVAHTQGNVLFDTGCHPSVVDDPARAGAARQDHDADHAENENVLTGLAAIGVQPDDIDVVICSHLHPGPLRLQRVLQARDCDRAGARRSRPRARRTPRRLASFAANGTSDCRSMKSKGNATCSVTGASCSSRCPVTRRGRWERLVALEHDGQFLLAADTVTLRSSLDTGVHPKNVQDHDALDRSFAEVRRIEAGGATVICGHDDAQWQTLRKGADAYE
jgi:glyoxylase-like metal-dependent hydrolase (beta-lactamase superfamily II)